MTELLTAAQMRAIEAAAIEAGAVTGLELMERAGRGTVEAILAEWPELAEGERRAVVLCGPGNNGGDGFVVARLLKERGWAVEVFLHGDSEGLPPDARANWERWVEIGRVQSMDASMFLRTGGLSLVVDAIFGIGLARRVPGQVGDVLRSVRHFRRRVALDVPSLLGSDDGVARAGWPYDIAAADLTVAFQRAKLGHYLGDGPRLCGRVRTVELQLEMRHLLAEAVAAGIRRPEDLVGWAFVPAVAGRTPGGITPYTRLTTAHPPRTLGSKFQGHKFDHGHALVLTGGPGRGGAARMAARGALRIGAGLVTLGCPPAALLENASRVDAIMTRSVRGAEGLAGMLEDARLNALCLGPGLGTGEREAALVRVALGGPAEAARDRAGEDPGAPGPTRGLDHPGAAGDAAGGDRGPGSGAEGPGDDGGLGPGADGRDSTDASSDRHPSSGAGALEMGEAGGSPGPTRGLDAPGAVAGPSGGNADRGLGSGAGAAEASGGDPAAAGAGGVPGEGVGGGSGASSDGARRDEGRRATVLDGDALTILGRESELFALLHARCVLTPHAGEFARLFPDLAERLRAPAETGPAYSKVDATREAAARAGCVVLFKGPDTVIAHPDGRAAINSAAYERSAPWLATAGAGDVLAGFIAGLLARGLEPMQAAEAAAWLHVECALEFGPGLIAEDLPEMLPRVLRRLGG